MSLKTYKVLAILLTYPEPEIIKALDELYQDVLINEKLLGEDALSNIDKLIQDLKTRDLLTLQEEYVALFDRSRRLSLHLFEHVHGDSRERGPAMVELAQTYRETGFSMKPKELPDYIPVFLEYLSSLPQEEAKTLLGQPLDILAAIAAKLKTRNSLYHHVFDAIVSLSDKKIDQSVIKTALLNDKKRPQTQEELDAEWEEKPAFSGNAAADCGSCALPKTSCSDESTPNINLTSTNSTTSNK